MIGILGIAIGLGFLYYGFVDLKRHRKARANNEVKSEEDASNKAPKLKLFGIVGKISARSRKDR